MKSSKLQSSIYLAGAVVLLIVFHYIGLLAPVERLVQKILNPVFSGFYASATKSRHFLERQATDRDLTSINRQLESDYARLLVENSALKSLEEENMALRQQLNFIGKEKPHFMMVNINSRTEVNNVSQSVILDKGSADGIAVGYPVIVGEGVVVGKVMEVKEHLAEACLITSDRCQFATTIQNQDRTIGLIKGELGLTVKMDFIPQTERITLGDTVITSGLEKTVPRGLVVGRVSQVLKSNKELWQAATIEPAVDFNDLILASVLLP